MIWERCTENSMAYLALVGQRNIGYRILTHDLSQEWWRWNNASCNAMRLHAMFSTVRSPYSRVILQSIHALNAWTQLCVTISSTIPMLTSRTHCHCERSLSSLVYTKNCNAKLEFCDSRLTRSQYSQNMQRGPPLVEVGSDLKLLLTWAYQLLHIWFFVISQLEQICKWGIKYAHLVTTDYMGSTCVHHYPHTKFHQCSPYRTLNIWFVCY